MTISNGRKKIDIKKYLIRITNYYVNYFEMADTAIDNIPTIDTFKTIFYNMILGMTNSYGSEEFKSTDEEDHETNINDICEAYYSTLVEHNIYDKISESFGVIPIEDLIKIANPPKTKKVKEGTKEQSEISAERKAKQKAISDAWKHLKESKSHIVWEERADTMKKTNKMKNSYEKKFDGDDLKVTGFSLYSKYQMEGKSWSLEDQKDLEEKKLSYEKLLDIKPSSITTTTKANGSEIIKLPSKTSVINSKSKK